MLKETVLSTLEELPSPLLTAYVNTQSAEPSAHGPSAANLVWLRQEAKQLVEQVSPRDRESLWQQAKRIEKFLNERASNERALVILSGPATWELIPLQLRVEPELHWGMPALTQLHWILTENKHHCVLVIDHKGARFFDYGLGEMRELAHQTFTINTSAWKKKDLGHVTGQDVIKTRGSQRDTFRHRMDAQYQRFCRQVAVRASRLFKANNYWGIFLVGSEELTKLVEEKLSSSIRAHTVLISEDLGKRSLGDLQEALASKIAEWEHGEETRMVARILEDDRKAVTGTDETLAQLQKGKLRTLVLARPLSASVRQCIECGWMDRSADPVCPVCGRERRTVELPDALIEAARTTNTDVEVVSGAAREKLNQAGGMAGWLRGRTRAELR